MATKGASRLLNNTALAEWRFAPDPITPVSEIGPEVALWRAVIARALLDATSAGEESDRRAADHWLTGDSAGFKRVCDWAAIDPDYVRQSYLKQKSRQIVVPGRHRNVR